MNQATGGSVVHADIRLLRLALRSSKHPAFLVFAQTESLFWVVTAPLHRFRCAQR
jgi:hypothetical protein